MTTYYAVIDTNVLVSALLKGDSNPGKIIGAVSKGVIKPLINDDIFREYDEVLSRDKFHFEDTQVEALLDRFLSHAVRVKAGPVTDIIPDAKDVVFYEVVMEARKTRDARLVTGHKRHFPQETFVVSPKEMLDIIQRGLSDPT